MISKTTLIRIKTSTKKELDSIGRKTDTYDDIISRLLQSTILNK